MKTNKYLTFALAAMAFASCGNGDDSGNGTDGVQGTELDAITVQFVETPSTYADETQAGEETENSIYHAFIFAQEASPSHQNAMEGDWTVKEVGALGNTTPIEKGDGTAAGTMENMVAFSGVTQGSKVYVIANDPKLTLAVAEELAHRGIESETKISNHIAQLDKSYLNSLVLKKGESPSKQFVMAGMATISTDPVPNGAVLKVPVALNREMAKVSFTGWVTTDNSQAASGKIEIKPEAGAAWGEADGLIVVRIPRKVSFFAAQENGWYYPKVGDKTTMDWGVDASSKEWTAFDGDSYKTPTEAAAADGEAFNNLAYNTLATAAEYRYTWKIGGGYATYTPETKKMYSPTFYVTPNYTTANANSTLILVQATYTGETTILPEFTENVMTVLGVRKLGPDYWDLEANLTDLLAKLVGYSGADAETNALKTNYPAGTDVKTLVAYKKNQKVFYKASISESGKTMTTRNTRYLVNGTITSLGAKNLADAIESDAIGMVVQVSVNPWRFIRTDTNL